MPKPKYRRPPQKEHKEKLESFTFASALSGVARKKSDASAGLYSPMGSRLPSRKNSKASLAGKGARTPRQKSLASSEVSSPGEAGEKDREEELMREGTMDTARPGMGNERFASESDDGYRNGGSSSNRNADPSEHRTDPEIEGLKRARRNENNDRHAHHRPFSEAEMTEALKKTHLNAPAGMGMSTGIPV